MNATQDEAAVAPSFPPRSLALDTPFHFYTAGAHPAVCRVRAFGNGRDLTIVLDELGSCDTLDSIDQVASQLLPYIITEPGRRDIITWIWHTQFGGEHYFDRITFPGFTPPSKKTRNARTPFGHYQPCARFERIGKEVIEKLIGSEWE